MGLPQKTGTWLSPEDYLRLEEAAETKHEYLDGVMYDWQGTTLKSMAGGTRAHNQASGNIYASLRQQLRGGPCAVVIADVCLHLADHSAYFYPDVAVTCSEADRARNDAISEPSLVVEVLSPTTEAFDRGDKFASYRRIESLQAYVLVSTERRTVEVFRRDNGWQPQGEPVREGRIELATLGVALDVSSIFEGL